MTPKSLEHFALKLKAYKQLTRHFPLVTPNKMGKLQYYKHTRIFPDLGMKNLNRRRYALRLDLRTNVCPNISAESVE